MKKHLLKNVSREIVRMSRLFLLIFFVETLCATFLLAENTRAQGQSIYEVTVKVPTRLVALKDMIKQLEKETDFNFTYQSSKVDLSTKVTLTEVNSLGEALEEVSKQTSLKFRRVGQNIHVSRKETGEDAIAENIESIEDVMVTGKITDDQGEPLPGATVVEVGTQNGTITDFEGNFKLSVSDNASVSISFVGFTTKVVRVGSQTVLNVQLEPDFDQLEEVVVIGYGTQRKADLTGSSVGVSAKEIEDIPVNSFEQALSGQVPGVQITQGNSAPGGGISMQIRGNNSISGNSEPLYVIDGVPIISNNALATPGGIGGDGNQNNDFNALSTLNPNDIADIQVLKDASATAIYGARGANGVVLITTKKGKVGKPSINLDTYIGFQSLANKVDLVSPEEFGVAVRESYTNGAEPLPISDAEFDALLADPRDWQDIVTRDPSEATISNIQLSVSGATDTDLNYFMSINNFKQNGIVRNSGFERNSFRLNLEKGFDNFRVGTNMSFSRTDADIVSAGNQISVTRYAISGSPIQPIFDENGEFLHETILSGGNSANPEALLQGSTDNLITDRLLGSIFAEYQIIKPLTFRTTLGIDIDRRDREIYFDRNTGPRFGGTDQPGWAQLANTNNTQLVTTNVLTYSPELSDEHKLTVTGVFEAQTFESSSFSVINRGFTSDVLGVNAISSGTQEGGPTLANSAFAWQLASWVGRTFYSYKDKYLVNATVRHDGSSRFGRNTRWGTFPSIGLGWRLSEEAFLSSASFIDDLKLRGSYGITGNQEIGVLQNAERYVPTLGTLFGGVLANGVEAVSFANPNLGWEESVQTNIGFDASFWQARLNLTFDMYNRTTRDLLLAVNIAPSSGFSPPFFNAGEIENRGFEIGLNAIPVENDDFQWNIGVNFSRNRNEVITLVSERTFGPGIEQTIDGSLIEPGQPIGVFFGYKTDGVYATQEEADADVTDGSLFVKEAGEFRYVDVNNDNQINADDRTIIGDPNPDFTYGINTTATWKGLSLNLIFQGVQGNDILWTNSRLIYAAGASDRHVAQERFDNRWTPENPNNAEFPKFNTNADITFSDDRLIFDGSFFRLRNVVLGYELPASVLEKVKLQRARIYVSGTNLFTITNYPGFNPDVNTVGQNTVNRGVDRSAYPLAKSWQMGLNLTF